MRKKLSIVLVVLAVVGIGVGAALATITTEPVGKFNRFVWGQNLSIPEGSTLTLDPIDTSNYDTLIVSVNGLSCMKKDYQPSDIWELKPIYAQVETRLYATDPFVPQQTRDGKDTFILAKPDNDSNAIITFDHPGDVVYQRSIGGSSSFAVDIQGVETRLTIVVPSMDYCGSQSGITVTGALIKRTAQKPGLE